MLNWKQYYKSYIKVKIYEKLNATALLLEQPQDSFFLKQLNFWNCSGNSSDQVLPYIKLGKNIFMQCHGSRQTECFSNVVKCRTYNQLNTCIQPESHWCVFKNQKQENDFNYMWRTPRHFITQQNYIYILVFCAMLPPPG